MMFLEAQAGLRRPEQPLFWKRLKASPNLFQTAWPSNHTFQQKKGKRTRNHNSGIFVHFCVLTELRLSVFVALLLVGLSRS